MAIVSVYAIPNCADEENWVSAWQVVQESYGVGAICRNILQSDAPLPDEALALEAALSHATPLNRILLEERNSGATHAFVQPEEGGAVFGVCLRSLFC